MQIEYKIGEKFTENGIKLVCIESLNGDRCNQINNYCYFIKNGWNCNHLKCSSENRTDKKPVIFIEVEK